MSLSVHGEDDAEELTVKPFTINLQLVTVTHEWSATALIDSGADCNVMSYEMWVQLGKPELAPSMLSFKNFSRTQTTSLGKLCLKVRIKDQSMHIVFHVTHENQAAVNVVLGRQWMGATNCQINWLHETTHYR